MPCNAKFSSILLAIWLLGSQLSASDASPSTSSPTEAVSNSEARQSPQEMVVVEDAVTVISASGTIQSLLEAPVPVSAISPQQIELESGASSVPKLFESLVGMESTQAGLFDFKLNTRGLNTAANRRLAVSIDGRDPSFPLIDSQEWATVMFPIDDLARAELVRGPSSAMYGTNAFNGVLNLISRSAQDSLGGGIRLTGGERDTQRAELRLASALGGGWYFKTTASFLASDDFYRSRHLEPEYSRFCSPGVTRDCLQQEASPLVLDQSRVSYTGARFETTWGSQLDFVIEGGHGTTEGTVFGSSSSRFQAVESERPWGRFALTHPRFEVSGHVTGRDAEFRNLLADVPSFSESQQYELKVKTQAEFARSRGRWFLGAAWTKDDLDTADPEGRQTLLAKTIDVEAHALFGQLNFDLNDQITLQVATRWDDNPLFGTHLSPQAALVWAPHGDQTVRLSYREGFIAPSYPEYFVRSAIGPSIDLSAFEAVCRSQGVSCGFETPVPFLAVGNEDLEPETVSTLEVGYSATIGSRSFLQATYYRSEARDFLQTSAPLVGSALGRINPAFGPYAPPDGLDPSSASALSLSLQSALGALFPFLTNPTPDAPILAPITAANSGRVDVQGLELSLDTRLARGFALAFSYTWTDFEAEAPLAGFQPIASNAPEHTVKAGLSYHGERWSSSLRYRWVDRFRWFEVLLNGPVLSYDVVDLSARFDIHSSWAIGLQASNVLDEKHYAFFSGDLLTRQVLLHIDFSW